MSANRSDTLLSTADSQQNAFIDPRALMAIRSLELRARVVVQGFWHGIHRSPYHGFSVEFTEYRQYSPGDDPRYLDWKLYARTDRYYIKKFEDETNLRCHLLVDNSRSMDYGKDPCSKNQYANTLAATLAYFLYLQGDAVGLLSFDEDIREYLPARNRTGHLRQLMLSLEKPASGKATNLERPLKRIAELVTKRGLIVLVSDLLAPLDLVEKNLTTLTAYGHELQIFQVLDQSEKDFSFDQPIVFEDIESGKNIYVDPKQVRSSYIGKLNDHLNAIQALCRKLGVGYQMITTNSPLEMMLFHFFRERMHRGKGVKRRSKSPSV